MSTQEREKRRKAERGSEQRWFERWQVMVAAVLGAMATVAAALLPVLLGGSSGATGSQPSLSPSPSAVTSAGHVTQATVAPSSPAVSGNAMCLDAGWYRSDKEPVTLYKCEAGNTDQAWVIDGAQVKVKDTLS